MHLHRMAEQARETLHDRQPDSEPARAVAARVVDLVELLEDPARLLGRDADAGVAHLDPDRLAAVARDLFARKITSAKKLGIYGGSNGGLLMGVELTQHPELWQAVTIQVPLLDMLRYEKIAAGASWVDEYGSVSVPAERAFLEKTSPYHNLKRGVAYPEPYIWTTTKDDRVGPQHARKFAARMKEYGLPYLFYEDTAGGHSGDADIAQGARLQALQMVYFTQRLVGPATE